MRFDDFNVVIIAEFLRHFFENADKQVHAKARIGGENGRRTA